MATHCCRVRLRLNNGRGKLSELFDEEAKMFGAWSVDFVFAAPGVLS